MRILLTGGTGYVGSHAAAALVRDGHEVRLLVRSPERIRPALEPLGVAGEAEHAVGDVLDRESVARAASGCDAAIHAAALYSLDVRRAAEMRRVNAPGTEIVLDEAARHGLDPIIYISSTSAFLPGTEPVAGPDSPVGDITAPYAATKVAAERVARRRQEAGDPVAIVYPGAIYGPDDPHVGEQAQLVRNVLRRRIFATPTGGFFVVGIDEVAATIRATLDAGGGAGRYIVPGHFIEVAEIAAELERLTGRRFPMARISARTLARGASALDRLQGIVPFRLPVGGEALAVVSANLRFDDSRTRRDLGITPRPFADTLAAMVRWLLARGLITERQAGTLGRHDLVQAAATR